MDWKVRDYRHLGPRRDGLCTLSSRHRTKPPSRLKIPDADITKDPDATQKLLREAQTTSALNHPNIVTIHEVIRSGSSTAIVMELVEGHLSAELCENRLAVEQAIGIGQQIARR